MPSAFWTNTIWYILLGFTSIISFILVLYKSENKKFDIGFFSALLGLAYHIEVILLPLLWAYAYFPKLVNEPYLDSLLGNAFSQTSISTSLMLITVFKLSKLWYIIFAAVYFFIEKIFIQLNIYIQFWYRTWITTVGFITLCYFTKLWYHVTIYSPKPYAYYPTLFLATYSISGNIELLFLFNVVRVFNFNIYDNFFRSQGILTQMYLVIIICASILIYKCCLTKLRKVIIFGILLFVYYLSTKLGIISIKEGWYLVVPLVSFGGCYLAVVIMDKLLLSRVIDIKGR